MSSERLTRSSTSSTVHLVKALVIDPISVGSQALIDILTLMQYFSHYLSDKSVLYVLEVVKLYSGEIVFLNMILMFLIIDYF